MANGFYVEPEYYFGPTPQPGVSALDLLEEHRHRWRRDGLKMNLPIILVFGLMAVLAVLATIIELSSS